MKTFFLILASFAALPAAASGQAGNPFRPVTLQELMIPVSTGHSREIAWTNKNAGVFYTETNGPHRSSWQGWRVMSVELMENFGISIDGSVQDPSTAAADCYPDRMIRKYPGGLTETFILLDGVDAIIVQLNNIHGKIALLRPYFSDSKSSKDYLVSPGQMKLMIARKRHILRNAEENYPAWLSLSSLTKADAVISGDTLGTGFSPGGLSARLSENRCTFVLVAGDTPVQTDSLAAAIRGSWGRMALDRRERIEGVLNRSLVRTDNERFDKALNWAKASLDALIMNQRGKGIFAGLPWFDNYWGRDSFIALPGATLVTGDFTSAKEILRSFSRWQDVDSTSTNYGRIPNFVSTTTIAYNTADGTPRFVTALDEYVRYSGDKAFGREMFPVVQRAIDGTIRYHTDKYGFLTHEDAETWMDAAGADGSWSPRGNRGNDIQALWAAQLRAGCSLGKLAGVPTPRWADLASAVNDNFSKFFIDSSRGLIFDHLNADGTSDGQMRPNQLVVAADPEFRLPADRTKILSGVTSKLVYPYGVASLSQEDENFHPYHHYEPFYVQDAAYHNGTVWTWLAGSWIDLAVRYGRQDTAFVVTENMVHQILERGAVGTLSELVDAVARPGEKEPRLSGTYSQAWSLSEFVRTFYQSYCGIRGVRQEFPGIGEDLPSSSEPVLLVNPELPPSVHHVAVVIPFQGALVRVTMDVSDRKIDLRLKSWGARVTAGLILPVEFRFRPGDPQGSPLESVVRLPEGVERRFNFSPAGIESVDSTGHTTRLDGNPVLNESVTVSPGITLAVPAIKPGLKALKGPSYRLLTHAETRKTNRAAKIICNAADPAGDDTLRYSYPTTVNLKPGSLDITHFTVAADRENCYFTLRFRALSDPGWHPEYGYQLTISAIAIDTGGNGGSQDAGENSHYTFPGKFRFQRLVTAGGGVRIADAAGTVMAEYRPSTGDEADPIGRASEGMVSFSLPNALLGTPQPSWKFAVLVGCQDDHGGAGIGEFRTVSQEAGEWTGGGKKIPSDSNVYDTILPESHQ